MPLTLSSVDGDVSAAEGRQEGEHPDDEDGHRDQELDEREAAFSLRSASRQTSSSGAAAVRLAEDVWGRRGSE